MLCWSQKQMKENRRPAEGRRSVFVRKGRGGSRGTGGCGPGIRDRAGHYIRDCGPAYAGIPVTHREHASQFTVFTGHEGPGKSESSLDYNAIATQPGTKVMLMGVVRIEKIAKR